MNIDDRLVLARAVTDSGRARLLEADNSSSRSVDLSEAVTGEGSYFVVPKPDLLVIDLDLSDDSSLNPDRLATLDLLLEAAARHQVPHVHLPSGRPGHRHAYFVIGHGEPRDRLERWCQARGLDVRTHGIRPPGTPHRNVSVLAWDDDLHPHHIATVLGARPSPSASAALAAELTPNTSVGLTPVSPRLKRALREGHQAARYASPSEVRMALAIYLVARNGTQGALRAALVASRSSVGESFTRRSLNWQRQELDRLWDKAKVRVATTPQVDPTVELGRVAAAADNAGWKGTSGGSDLAILEAMLRRASQVPTLTVAMSLDQIAVEAGVSRDTARAGTRRLMAAEWLRVASPETPTEARAYSIHVPPGVATAGSSRVPDRDGLDDLGIDLARFRALGKVTYRVIRTLRRDPGCSVQALAAALSMTRSSVRHHLRKLVNRGLIRQDRHGWWSQLTNETADDAAVAMGVDGTRRRQAELWQNKVRLRRAWNRASRSSAQLRSLSTATVSRPARV